MYTPSFFCYEVSNLDCMFLLLLNSDGINLYILATSSPPYDLVKGFIVFFKEERLKTVLQVKRILCRDFKALHFSKLKRISVV